jgi:hypothetical protein
MEHAINYIKCKKSNTYTHDSYNLHWPLTGLTFVQKGVAYSVWKDYKNLPPQIKNILNNVALFKSTLMKFLLQYVFYSIVECYQKNYNDYGC